jgi:hypothetical protein
MAFSAAPRRAGRRDLSLTGAELDRASRIHPGFRPDGWTLDQTARTLLVLTIPATDPAEYRRALDGLFDDADLGELVALYQSLPLLPHPEAFVERAAEGIRSNMKAVFEAVALRNPYPADRLSEDAFNQLVLKCLFVESPLHLVVDVDRRVNSALARMLVDYAHERWAAGRPVSAELWRCVGPVADGTLLDDLRHVLVRGTQPERLAVALSCTSNSLTSALRSEFPDVFSKVDQDPPSWRGLATTPQ